MIDVLERMRAVLVDHSLQFDASERLPLTVSAGVCLFPDHADSVTALLTVMALTLQEAKSSGGDAVRVAGRPIESEPGTRTFDVFQGLIFAVDTKDRYTKQHSEDVARYGVFLAERLRPARPSWSPRSGSPGCSTTSARSASPTGSCASPAA